MENYSGVSQCLPIQQCIDIPKTTSTWRDMIRTRERIHYLSMHKSIFSKCYKFAIPYHERIVHSLVVLRTIADMVSALNLIICTLCENTILFKPCKINEKLISTGEHIVKSEGKIKDIITEGVENYKVYLPNNRTDAMIEKYNRKQYEYARPKYLDKHRVIIHH